MSDDAQLPTFTITYTESRFYSVTVRVIAGSTEEAIAKALNGDTEQEVNRDFSPGEDLSVDAVWQDGKPVPFIDPLNEDEGEKIANGELEEEA